MSKRYQEGQEDQLAALGLVVNAVLLRDPCYLQNALDHLRQDGMPVLDGDFADLSTLRYEHINVLGHNSFTFADAESAGKY